MFLTCPSWWFHCKKTVSNKILNCHHIDSLSILWLINKLLPRLEVTHCAAQPRQKVQTTKFLVSNENKRDTANTPTPKLFGELGKFYFSQRQREANFTSLVLVKFTWTNKWKHVDERKTFCKTCKYWDVCGPTVVVTKKVWW